MQHETKYLHFIACLQLAVLALHNVIVATTQISEYQSAVWEPRNLNAATSLQVGRAQFSLWRFKIGITSIFYCQELVPVGIAQIACYGIEGCSMGRSLIMGKTEEALQRSGSYTDFCLALDVKRQQFAVRRQAQVTAGLALE